jgi:hypothetical protein
LAKNGFCSIAKSLTSETGEGYIYDFTYYMNNKFIDVADFTSMLYSLEGA